MDPEGMDCPAAAPLCVCGVRGCPDLQLHVNGFELPQGNRTRGGRSHRHPRRRKR